MSNGDEKEIEVRDDVELENDEEINKEAQEFLRELTGSAIEEEEAPGDLEVEKYKKLADENFRLYKYCAAELDNYKKRVRQEKEEYRKYGLIPFAKEILHVVDNLERALEHLENADKESLTQGINMTLDQFNKTLERFGITRILSVGEPFDPNKHDALMMVETDDKEPNIIVGELQKGYILNERLVRPSKVSVSTAPKKEAARESENENLDGEQNKE